MAALGRPPGGGGGGGGPGPPKPGGGGGGGGGGVGMMGNFEQDRTVSWRIMRGRYLRPPRVEEVSSGKKSLIKAEKKASVKSKQ